MSHETLVIAPINPDLGSVPDEAATVAALTDGRLLPPSDATVRGLFAHTEGRQYRHMWFCTHADERGIWLNDGDLLDEQTLHLLLNRIGVEVVILNACHSVLMAVGVLTNSDADVMYASGEIDDRKALSMATAIAQEYSKTRNMEVAHRNVSRGNPLFNYLPNARRSRVYQQQSTNGTKAALEYLRRDIDTVSRKIDSLEDAHSKIIERLVALEVGRTTVNVNQSPWENRAYFFMIAAGFLIFWWATRGA